MSLKENSEYKITQTGYNAIKKICAKINDKSRKRAFKALICLDVLADYLAEQGFKVDISKNLYKIFPVNEEFEYTDLHYNGQFIDILPLTDSKNFLIPKIHFEYGLIPDLYIIADYDNKSQNVKFIGCIEPQNIDKSNEDSKYFLMTTEKLLPPDAIEEKLKVVKQNSITEISHDLFDSLFIEYLDGVLTKENKKRLIRHLIQCEECRNLLVEFFDYETIVQNTAKYPEILNDHTLDIVGAAAVNDEKYKNFEEVKIKIDKTEPEEIDYSQNEDDITDANDSDISSAYDPLQVLYKKGKNKQIFELLNKNNRDNNRNILGGLLEDVSKLARFETNNSSKEKEEPEISIPGTINPKYYQEDLSDGIYESSDGISSQKVSEISDNKNDLQNIKSDLQISDENNISENETLPQKSQNGVSETLNEQLTDADDTNISEINDNTPDSSTVADKELLYDKENKKFKEISLSEHNQIENIETILTDNTEQDDNLIILNEESDLIKDDSEEIKEDDLIHINAEEIDLVDETNDSKNSYDSNDSFSQFSIEQNENIIMETENNQAEISETDENTKLQTNDDILSYEKIDDGTIQNTDEQSFIQANNDNVLLTDDNSNSQENNNRIISFDNLVFEEKEQIISENQTLNTEEDFPLISQEDLLIKINKEEGNKDENDLTSVNDDIPTVADSDEIIDNTAAIDLDNKDNSHNIEIEKYDEDMIIIDDQDNEKVNFHDNSSFESIENNTYNTLSINGNDNNSMLDNSEDNASLLHIDNDDNNLMLINGDTEEIIGEGSGQEQRLYDTYLSDDEKLLYLDETTPDEAKEQSNSIDSAKAAEYGINTGTEEKAKSDVMTNITDNDEDDIVIIEDDNTFVRPASVAYSYSKEQKTNDDFEFIRPAGVVESTYQAGGNVQGVKSEQENTDKGNYSEFKQNDTELSYEENSEYEYDEQVKNSQEITQSSEYNEYSYSEQVDNETKEEEIKVTEPLFDEQESQNNEASHKNQISRHDDEAVWNSDEEGDYAEEEGYQTEENIDTEEYDNRNEYEEEAEEKKSLQNKSKKLKKTVSDKTGNSNIMKIGITVAIILLITGAGITASIILNKNKQNNQQTQEMLAEQNSDGSSGNEYNNENMQGNEEPNNEVEGNNGENYAEQGNENPQENTMGDYNSPKAGTEFATTEDMNKAVVNAFSDNPSSIFVRKVSWGVNAAISNDYQLRDYLQITGRNIQENIRNNVRNLKGLNPTQKPRIQIKYSPEGIAQDFMVLQSSGTEELDTIVLQSVKDIVCSAPPLALSEESLNSNEQATGSRDITISLSVLF